MDPRQAEAAAAMAAMVRGERAALARLIALYGAGIRRYAAQVLLNATEAEDVAQEVFLRAWSKAASYDPAKGAVSSWLYRIAVNLCIDHNRRGRFRRFVGIDSIAEPEDDTPGAEAGLDARQRLALTRAAIRALPQRQRQAILLKAVGELSGAEIAAALNTSEGAVEQLLVRARAALRARLEKED
ncbi:RNA polymerase sigma factor [Celeribacter persicus]|uniref:RNA polymerase sigma factor n=1 Tax=Celeribacter persicus TaxID=1651082 RepID=A0A2T5HVC3_9RHOB|nr:sigma-70 family RNA polymerase sigma factor [Celeribacter persicus]PTQ75511.1 RNA polymerase sigma-70 factor (ECF subfamily) [Celeribacter persicus]